MQLVFNALPRFHGYFTTLPPSIMKPQQLWSGKQVLSTVLLNIIPDGQEKLNLTSRAKIAPKVGDRRRGEGRGRGRKGGREEGRGGKREGGWRRRRREKGGWRKRRREKGGRGEGGGRRESEMKQLHVCSETKFGNFVVVKNCQFCQ